MSASAGGGPLPRWLRWFGLPALGLALFALFLVLGFPYDTLARRIEYHADKNLGTTLSIGRLRPYVGLGLGFRADDMMLRARGSAARLRVDTLAFRPAWSLSWFRGVPALYLDAESPVGTLQGTAFLGTSEAGWNGQLRGVRLDELPLDGLLDGLGLDAEIDADVDLMRAETLEGHVDLRAKEGSVAFPGSPIAVPFDTLTGQIEFGGDHFARIESLDMEGPMLSGELTGTIGHAPNPSAGALALEGEVEVHERSLQDMMNRLGLRLARDGTAPLTIGGTVSDPRLAR